MSTLDLGKIKQLWRGTWSPSSSYLPNDVVAYNGAVWICTQGHGVGSSTEFSPGKRDRSNALLKTVDANEINVFYVTVGTVSNVNYFFIDGRAYPSLTLYANVHYRFYQKDNSNLTHRLALSTTADGYFGSGGVELSTSSTTYTYQYNGTPGIDGVLDVILPSSLVGTLYYFSATDVGYGGAALTPKPAITLTPSYRGYQYWDQLTSGYRFQGAYSAITQYYYNDIVEYQGATYLALADSIGSFPTNPITGSAGHNWMLLVNGDRRSEHNSAGWFMNKGPINWPYPHGNSGNSCHSKAMKWISRSGRVYQHGTGDNYNNGLNNTGNGGNGTAPVQISFPQEITFNHADWWNSRDNGGPGRLVTPDGMPPRCIQIEAGYQWAHYLFNNGEVWGHGPNGSGYLGTGDATGIGMPKRVIGLNDVKIIKISAPTGTVSSEAHHILALDDQGNVWSWGSNNSGQLGLGTTSDMYTAQRIPRSYFNNERVIDILTMGATTSGVSYARTAQNNLYAWGYNGASQLGTNDSSNRYRPVQMLNWTPSTSLGITKWQAASTGNNATFMLLDGQGFLWQTGADVYAASGNTAVGNRTQLTKSILGINGSIANFWLLWSSDNQAFVQNVVRAINGQTYICGASSTLSSGNNTLGFSGQTTPASGQLITSTNNPLPTTLGSSQGIINVVDVFLHLSNSGAYRTISFLTATGKIFSQGYNNFGELGNPGVPGGTANPFDETGTTYLPVVTYVPPGTKIIQLMPSGWGNTDQSIPHAMFAMADSGQVFAWGEGNGTVGNTTADGSSFTGFNNLASQGTGVFMPTNIQYAR